MHGFKENQGRCYSFDQRASGFVAAEGCVAAAVDSSDREGSVVSANVRILCSVTRCAGESASLTAPNRDSQTILLRSAWHLVGRHPDVLEVCHGASNAVHGAS
jgi:acyl transferase domain-containing protein